MSYNEYQNVRNNMKFIVLLRTLAYIYIFAVPLVIFYFFYIFLQSSKWLSKHVSSKRKNRKIWKFNLQRLSRLSIYISHEFLLHFFTIPGNKLIKNLLYHITRNYQFFAESFLKPSVLSPWVQVTLY